MSISRSISVVIAVTVAALGVGAPASAQSSHVAGPAVLQRAIETQATSDASDRAVVRRVLETSEAQVVAARLGVDLARAQSGVATLDAATLAQLATTARAAETQLSGGRVDTIVISLTTLLLILIVVLLLVK